MNKKKIIISVILCVICVFFVTDSLRTKVFGVPPLFCVKLLEYSEGGSADYYGAGYKIWRDCNTDDDSSEYYISLWILPKAICI